MSDTSIIYSLGHSNRARDEFLQILFSWDLDVLVDVRRYPESTRFPHFRASNLEEDLPDVDVRYRQLGERLGGYLEDVELPVDMERISGWEVDGFKPYAAYTESKTFRDALEQLEEWAREEATVFMCAEGWYRKCHRQLIADQLLAREWIVRHIQSPDRAEDHEFLNVVATDDQRAWYREPGNEGS